MGDNDISGQFEELIRILLSPTWRELWLSLKLPVETFETLGLTRDSPDVEVWKVCQSRQVILVTANRNQEGPDSLESAIRERNEAGSLPVFTIAAPRAVLASKAYAERVAVRLLDYLLDIDKYRGAGRLWLP
jgi:hypothetical protein